MAGRRKEEVVPFAPLEALFINLQKPPDDYTDLDRLRDFRAVFSDVRGERVLWQILKMTGVWRLSYKPGDQAQTALNEGARSVGLRLFDILCGDSSVKPRKFKPEDYVAGMAATGELVSASKE